MAETLSNYLLQFVREMVSSLAGIANLFTLWMEFAIAPVCVLPRMRRLRFTTGDGRALKIKI